MDREAHMVPQLNGLVKLCYFRKFLESWSVEGFPGGAVVKNPPASAGDTGSSPDPGRSHMLQSSQARAPQLLEPAL